MRWLNVALFLICALLVAPALDAQDRSPEAVKSDFILRSSKLIHFPKEDAKTEFRIGVFGKGAEVKELVSQLEADAEGLKIDQRQVSVLHFKKAKSIETPDILYVSGKSKIRISDLNESLGDHPCIILTENFPFGTSMFNFTVQENQVFYEIRSDAGAVKGIRLSPKLLNNEYRIQTEAEWQNKVKGLQRTIHQQREVLNQKEDEIEEKEEELAEKVDTIVTQQAVIAESKDVIESKNTILIVVSIFVVLLGILAFFLVRLLKQRKEMFGLLKERNEEVLASINYAKRIQDSLLTEPERIQEIFPEHFLIFKPKDVVSGDFYWFEKREHKRLFTVADCTGHGVPGAFLSAMGTSLLNEIFNSKKLLAPDKVLKELNRLVVLTLKSYDKRHAKDGMDLAFCSVDDSDPKQPVLEYSGANNRIWLVRKTQLGEPEVLEGQQPDRFQNNGYTLFRLKADRRPINHTDLDAAYTRNRLLLKPEDRIYLFSDGYPDQFGGPDNKKFKYKPLRELILSVQHMTMKHQREVLLDIFQNWKGEEEQIDDVSMLGITV